MLLLRIVHHIAAVTLLVQLLGCSSYRPARDQLEPGRYRVVNSVDSDYEVELTAPATIMTLDVSAGSRVTFEGPNLKAIKLAEACVIEGRALPAKSKLEFAFGGYYAGTQLTRVTLGGPVSSGRSELSAGDVVTLEGPRIRTAVLEGPHTLDGARFPHGEHVTFDDAGHVRSHMSSAQAARAAEDAHRAAKATEEARRDRQLACTLKCGGNLSCKEHCLKYGD